MNLFTDFLGILESAIQNPQDKAAVKIAIDGIAAWKAIATLPAIQLLEADIGAYVAAMPPGAAPPTIATPQPSDLPPIASGKRGS